MKFEKLKPGMVLYDRHKHRAGNTMMRVLGEWPVRIIEIRDLDRTAVVSWNSNRPEVYYERELTKLKDWSMHDAAELERRGMERVENRVGTIAVRKRRAASARSGEES